MYISLMEYSDPFYRQLPTIWITPPHFKKFLMQPSISFQKSQSPLNKWTLTPRRQLLNFVTTSTEQEKIVEFI